MASSSDSVSQNDVKYLKSQLSTARNEINNLRQQLKTLTHSHKKEFEEVQRHIKDFKCTKCHQEVETEASTSALPVCDLPINYIGTIHTQFPEKRATPRQPSVSSELTAKLTINNDVLTNPDHALEGLQEFSHLWILFHFHRNDSTHIRAKVAPPRLNGLRTGVFATRSPHRPNPIGLSLVKIDRIMENTIYFSGVDMVDQTPVLDIKPYIPQYDNPTLNADNHNLEAFPDIVSVIETQSGGEVDVASEALENLSSRIMDGDENGGRDLNFTNSSRNSANSSLEENLYPRSTSRMGEREAPDGEEDEEAPRMSVSVPSMSSEVIETPIEGLRIPNWVDDQRSHQLIVHFKDSAVAQLNQLGTTEEAEEKVRTISSVLREDPRSVFLRYRIGNNYFVFRIASLLVSCKFNDADRSVTVFKISQMSDNED